MDSMTSDFIESLLQMKMSESQRAQLTLKARDAAGLGLGAAEHRRVAAWVGAWEDGLANVVGTLGYQSLEAFEAAWPAWAGRRNKQDKRLAAATGKPAGRGRWIAALTEGAGKSHTKQHAEAVKSRATKEFLASLNEDDKLNINMASGPETGAYLNQEEGVPEMPDTHFAISTRRRLRSRCPTKKAGPCRHKRVNGNCCGIPAGADGGFHCTCCPIGGGTVRRHDAIRDALCEWLATLNIPHTSEQYVPRWHTEQ